MAWVQPGRWLDSATFGLIAMFLSGLSLHLMGEMWGMTQRADFQFKWPKLIMKKLFPFNKTFDVNLTHIILFTIVIILISMRPDHECPTYSKAMADERKAAAEDGEEGKSGRSSKGKKKAPPAPSAAEESDEDALESTKEATEGTPKGGKKKKGGK